MASLTYSHTNGKSDEIFLLLKEDAYRRIGENLLIELSCFRLLMYENRTISLTAKYD
jgi:hypothetical protein